MGLDWKELSMLGHVLDDGDERLGKFRWQTTALTLEKGDMVRKSLKHMQIDKKPCFIVANPFAMYMHPQRPNSITTPP